MNFEPKKKFTKTDCDIIHDVISEIECSSINGWQTTAGNYCQLVNELIRESMNTNSKEVHDLIMKVFINNLSEELFEWYCRKNEIYMLDTWPF